jgi:hypothetical protein
MGDVVRIVDSVNQLPVGVEASIGVYQAIDVGTTESGNRASASATRAADARPNLTSEDAAEKRVEQPS